MATKKDDSEIINTTGKQKTGEAKKKSSTKSAKKTTSKKTVKKSTKKTTTRKKTSTKKAASKKTVKKSRKKQPEKSVSKEIEVKNSKLEKVNKDIELSPDADLRGDNPMTVVEHLDEFRSRIIYILISIIVFTLAALYFSDTILNFIIAPFKDIVGKLNIFSMAEPFMLKLKAAGIAGLMLSLPVILVQIWKFILPAINKEDRWFGRISFSFALILFYGGISAVYFGLLPMVIKVLQNMVTENMVQVQGASNYISFLFMFSFAMGILFELPIIAIILTKIGILSPQFLIAKRKYAIVAIWIIAALITPADPLSQIIVAVPIMFLYEISIVFSKIIINRKRKKGLID